MNELKEKMSNLIDVKSIMTLCLTLFFCILAVTDKVSGDQFLTVYTVVVSFFFGTKNGQLIAEAERTKEKNG